MSTVDEIAEKAYELWEKEGKPNGKDLEHWFQAETQLGERLLVSSETDVKPKSARSTTRREQKK